MSQHYSDFRFPTDRSGNVRRDRRAQLERLLDLLRDRPMRSDALIDHLGPTAKTRVGDLRNEGWDVRSHECPVSKLTIYSLNGRLEVDAAKARETIVGLSRIRLDGNNQVHVKPYSPSTCQDHETSQLIADQLTPVLTAVLRAPPEHRGDLLTQLTQVVEDFDPFEADGPEIEVIEEARDTSWDWLVEIHAA